MDGSEEVSVGVFNGGSFIVKSEIEWIDNLYTSFSSGNNEAELKGVFCLSLCKTLLLILKATALRSKGGRNP